MQHPFTETSLWNGSSRIFRPPTQQSPLPHGWGLPLFCSRQFTLGRSSWWAHRNCQPQQPHKQGRPPGAAVPGGFKGSNASFETAAASYLILSHGWATDTPARQADQAGRPSQRLPVFRMANGTQHIKIPSEIPTKITVYPYTKWDSWRVWNLDKVKPCKAFEALRGCLGFFLAETYRSRTYQRPFDRPPVLKTGRHTGDETFP